MDQVQTFLGNPLVAALYTLLVIKGIDLLLAVYRSIQQGTFDWKKLPSILDSTVLQQVIPLAALGISTFFVTEPIAHTGLVTTYVSLAATANAAAIAALLQKITGAYTATTSDQDRLLPLVPASTSLTGVPKVKQVG